MLTVEIARVDHKNTARHVEACLREQTARVESQQEKSAWYMSLNDPIDLSEQADSTERARPCPVCQGSSFLVLLTPADVDAEHGWLQAFRRQRKSGTNNAKDLVAYTQIKPTFIVRCNGCGTVLRDPQPTCERLRTLYADDTYNPATLDQLTANQDSFFRCKAEWVKPYLPASAEVLEVGSFVGSFLRAARALGWRAVGVDVGAQTCAYTRAAGLDILQGDIQEVELPPASWDGLFIWNTFDQLCDPDGVLDRAFTLLRQTGILGMRIPNALFEQGCLQLRRHWRGTRRAGRVMYAQAYNSFLTFPYLAGYTVDSIGRLLRRHGFTIDRIAGDTLVRLADRTTLPFAAHEEARYQRLIRRFCRRLEVTAGRLYYPWLDIIARKQI
ncbi:MAG: methyltransferase domain-containing protein [Candidatus Competibacteraceae bacterium]